MRQRSKSLALDQCGVFCSYRRNLSSTALTNEPARLAPQQTKEIEQRSRIDATDSIPTFEDSSWAAPRGFAACLVVLVCLPRVSLASTEQKQLGVPLALQIARCNVLVASACAGAGAELCAAGAARAGRCARRIRLQLPSRVVICGGQGQGRARGGDHGRVVRRSTPAYKSTMKRRLPLRVVDRSIDGSITTKRHH